MKSIIQFGMKIRKINYNKMYNLREMFLSLQYYCQINNLTPDIRQMNITVK